MKTDKADAAALARFLKLGYLPQVPVPSERTRQLRELLKARETLVSLRTKLKNMAHAALTRNGIKVARSAFASEIARERLLTRDDLARTDVLILQTAIRQIRELDQEIRQLEVRRFNKSGEKTVFGKISKRCGKNMMMNSNVTPSRKFLTGNRSNQFPRN